MKKIASCIIGLIALNSSSVMAQIFSIGPKVGANFSSFSGVDDINSKTGVYFGAFTEIKFLPKIAIQPEILYTVQGGEFSSVMIPNGSVENKINNHYVSVPIMLKYNIIGGLGIQFGPKFDFLTKSETKIGGVSNNSKDSFKSFNFGLGIGLGIDLPFGFFADARYNFGLSNVNKNMSIHGIPVESKSIKNDDIQLGVGYKF